MDIKINEDELKLLAYLHEHATGFTQESEVEPGKITAALGIELEQFNKDASFLASFGFVGKNATNVTSYQGPTEILWNGIWLTAAGENYMRHLEAAPGVMQKITVAVVGGLWQFGKGAPAAAANQELAKFLKLVGHR